MWKLWAFEYLQMDCNGSSHIVGLVTTQPNYTVYRRKGAYRFKTAFPEPYPLQKRSISAKNKLSNKQWHQKLSKIISSINYMMKMAMQRNNREAIRQKSNSHTFVDDADF